MPVYPYTPTGDLLGFCTYCTRVRWLEVVEREVKDTPYGMCRSCARERKEV